MLTDGAAAITGVKVRPAVFQLGSGRNLELGLTAAINFLTNGDRYFFGGVQATYLFY